MPSERDLYRMYAGGEFPMYEPPQRSRSLLDLTMLQGQQRADAYRQSGDFWGNTIANIGQGIGQALEKRDTEKKLRRRDAAWVDFVGRGDWSTDPKKAYAETVKIWGPEEGPKQFQALVGVSQLMQPKRDQAADSKALGAIGGAMGKMDDAGRAALWPQAIALTKSAFPHVELPAQYDPQVWKHVEPLFAQLSGEKPAESFTLSPGQQRFGPDGKPLAAVPPEVKEQPGFSLGPGDVRYDASGQPIASRPAAPREPRAAEPLEAVMGPDGNPVLVPRSQAAGKRPASNREQGRPVISGDANRISEINTAVDDMAVLKEALSGAGKTGMVAGMKARVPDWATSLTGIGAEAKVTQSLIDQMRQTFGKTLEDGVLRKEDEVKYAKILPKITDSPEVVKGKIPQLVAQMERNRENRLNALEDAGYEVGRFRQRLGGVPTVASEADYAKLPSGAEYIDPNGKRKRKR